MMEDGAPELPAAAARRPFTALRQFARRAAESVEERCDLCGERIGQQHRHLLDIRSRQLLCACRACTLLFDQAAAGVGARRLVPTRYLSIGAFQLGDAEWDSLQVPVNMAFFTANSVLGRVQAFYPSPAGPTESLLGLDTWEEMRRRNPILGEMAPDVEALLVNRLRGAREHYLVPIDECYRLVGLIRLGWRGLGGGREVWQEIEQFFAGVKERAVPVEVPHA